MVYLPLWIPFSSSPAATDRQSRCGRRQPGFYGRHLPSVLPPLTESRQNDNTHKCVASDNNTVACICFGGFSFGWGRAGKRGLRWMGINFASKSDLSQSRRRSDTGRRNSRKMVAAKVGTAYTWIERSCRVSHCLYCLSVHPSVAPRRWNSRAATKTLDWFYITVQTHTWSHAAGLVTLYPPCIHQPM